MRKHTGRGTVSKLVKLGEGGFNRVFLLTLEDESEVIVKIPYHLSVPKYYATASEVAILTFLRSKGVPVPEVYGYSTTADNAVGVEYIVMEKASGIGLDTKWFDLTKVEQRTVATEIVDVEKKLFSLPFGAVGSLYFKDDVPTQMQANLYLPGTTDPDGDSDTFCIGPISDYMFWVGKRSEPQVDHGPCKCYSQADLSHKPLPVLKLIIQQGVNPLITSFQSAGGSSIGQKNLESLLKRNFHTIHSSPAQSHRINIQLSYGNI